jgi:hypothetical protein
MPFPNSANGHVFVLTVLCLAESVSTLTAGLSKDCREYASGFVTGSAMNLQHSCEGDLLIEPFTNVHIRSIGWFCVLSIATSSIK